MIKTTVKGLWKPPNWAENMDPGYWYCISGDASDLGLVPTPVGTHYLEDNDPAQDPSLNPPGSLEERLRRLVGREWVAPWRGRVGFSSLE